MSSHSKVWLLNFLLLITSYCFSQPEKGRWIAGGNASISSLNSNATFSGMQTKSESTAISFGPRLGYFLTDHFVAGVALNYSKMKSMVSNITKVESSATDITASPFIRFYYSNLFVQGEYGIGTTHTNSSPGQERKFRISKWSAGIGYVVFLNKNTGIELLIGHQTSIFNEVKAKSRNNTSGLFGNLGFQVFLGRGSVSP